LRTSGVVIFLGCLTHDATILRFVYSIRSPFRREGVLSIIKGRINPEVGLSRTNFVLSRSKDICCILSQLVIRCTIAKNFDAARNTDFRIDFQKYANSIVALSLFQSAQSLGAQTVALMGYRFIP
jgi:hypothetical protein